MRTTRLVGIVAAYAVACRVMLAPICNFGALASATYEGDVRLVVWALAWDNRALATGRPLFDANIFYPTPASLAYGEHFFGVSLFSLPVYLATSNPVLAYNVVWLLSYALSAWAVHYLVWRLTRDHLAAIVAGMAYTFSFYRMHHGHGHLHLLWGFWIPASLIAMERWVATRSWRRLGLLVAILVLQALSSWYQAVMIFVADAALFVWLTVIDPLVARGWPWSRNDFRRLGVQAAAGAAVALVMVWPFARHYRVLVSGGPVEAGAASADATALLMPPENTWLGQWLLHGGVSGPRWIWGELTLYLGSITLLLALVGALVAISGRTAWASRFRFFILLGLVSLALALGPSAAEIADNRWHWSAFGLLARIPGADLFRAPARFAALLTLALAALAGAASAYLNARFGRTGRVVSIVAVPLLLSEFYVVGFPSGQPKPFPIPAVYRSLATLPAGPVVSLPDYAAGNLWFREPDYQLFSTAHWFPIVNGYSRAVPPGFTDRMQRLTTFPEPTGLDALREIHVRYVVVHSRDFPAGPAVVERARTDARLRLLGRFDADYLFEVLP